MKGNKHTSSSTTRITRSKSSCLDPIETLSIDLSQDDTNPQQVQEVPLTPRRDVSELSSPHPEEDISTTERENGVKNERRTRGPTRCKEIWTLNEQEKIPIKTNEYGQPINDHTSKLSNFLGTVIRRHGLLNGTDWRLVDKTIKDDMWEDVKSRFEFDGDCKEWVLRSIAKKRRAWKTRIKANYFDPFETDEERVRACQDNRIDSDTFMEALEFWNSEKGQVISIKNKASRAQQTISHTSGTKSFARVRVLEKKKMPNGEDPSRAHIFMVTHTRKNGNPIDVESARVISRIQELYSEQLEDSQMMDKVSRKDIFSQVMGEDGRTWVRTIGMGPTPSKVFGDKTNRVSATNRASTNDVEVQNMREEMKVLQSTVQTLGHCLVRVLQNGGGSTNNINVNDMLGALNLPMINSQGPNSTDNILDIGSPHEHSFSRVSDIDRNNERPSLVISRGKDPQSSNEKIVEEVFLKSWIEGDIVVASGIIVSRDSKKKVGGVELGDFFNEISIEIPIQPLAPLIRPYGELKTIGDAIGKTVAWLKTHVVKKGA